VLSLLAGYDLQALGHNSPAYVHLLTEALKLTFADRERYYGDPEFVDVPMSALLSEAYAAERRQLIQLDKAEPGMPPAGVPGSTRHICVWSTGKATSYPPHPAMAVRRLRWCLVLVWWSQRVARSPGLSRGMSVLWLLASAHV
jgi:gamma-glutamyltranspeptidase/glutathione hydrolase